jgi:hypothetical protein
VIAAISNVAGMKGNERASRGRAWFMAAPDEEKQRVRCFVS